MSLFFNTLSRFVIAFLPRSKHLLISWLQLPSTMILEPKKIKSVTVSLFPHIFVMKVPAKTVSKIYRKHLAESTGRSRGHQEVQGRYTLVCVAGSWSWGTGNGCGTPVPHGGKHITVAGVLADPSDIFNWDFNVHISSQLPVHDLCREDPIKKVKGNFRRVCSRV